MCSKTLCRRIFLTQFFYRGWDRLTGVSYGLGGFHSVCPAGACVGKPGCSHCRGRTTEWDNYTSLHDKQRAVKPLPRVGLSVLSCQYIYSPRSSWSPASASAVWRQYLSKIPALFTLRYHGTDCDQYPFPAASNYNTMHILNGCSAVLHLHLPLIPWPLSEKPNKLH